MPRIALRRGLRRAWRSRSGDSIVFSTVIISSVIFMIAIITASVANNVLELQMQATEFENAKMGMRLLSELITDVGLRHGSGGSVRFNARAGGFNMETIQRSFRVQWNASPGNYQNITQLSFDSLINLSFRGGSGMSTYNFDLVGSSSLFVDDPSAPLAYLRTEQKNGAWIRLDFNRIRIVQSGEVSIDSTKYYYVDLTFIRLVPGSYGGSYPPTLNVKVQNLGVEVTTIDTSASTINIRILVDGTPLENYYRIYAPKSSKIVLTITIAKVSISLAGGG